MTDFIYDLGTFVLWVLAIGCWSFVLLFHTLARWRDAAMGRHMMAFMGTFSVLSSYSAIAVTFSLSLWIRAPVRLLLFAGMAYVVWRRVHLFIVIQREVRAKTMAELWKEETPHAD